MGNQRTNEEWIKLIQDCEKSGSTHRQWCIKNNIPHSSFYSAYKRLNKDKVISCNNNEVVEIPIVDEIAPAVPVACKENTPPAVVFSYNGCLLEINYHADKKLLEKVFQLVRNL